MHKKKANRGGSKKRGGSRNTVTRGVSSRRSVERGVSSRRERGKSRYAKSRHAKSRHAMRGGDTKTKVAAAVVAATGLAISASYYKNHVLLKQKLTRSFDTFKELEWEKIVELLGHFEIRLDSNLLDKVKEEFEKIKSGGITSTMVVDHPHLQRFLPKQKENYNDFFKDLINSENSLYTFSQSSAGVGVMKSAGMISLSSTRGDVVSTSTSADASAHTAESTIVLLLLLWYYFDCSFTTLFLNEHFKLKLYEYTRDESGGIWESRSVSIVPNTLRFAQVINSIDFNSFNDKTKFDSYMDEEQFNTYGKLKTKLEKENNPRLDCLKKFNLNQELERDEYD